MNTPNQKPALTAPIIFLLGFLALAAILGLVGLLTRATAANLRMGDKAGLKMTFMNSGYKETLSASFAVTQTGAYFNQRVDSAGLLYVYFDFKNTGKSGIPILEPENTFIKDNNGRTYTGLAVGREAYLFENLGPGVSASKAVAFKVPPDLLTEKLFFGIGDPNKNRARIDLSNSGDAPATKRAVENNYNAVRAAFTAVDYTKGL